MSIEQTLRVKEAEEAIETALAPARVRFEAADPETRALRPAELDWASPEELVVIHSAQTQLRDALGDWNTPAAAAKRVQAKRAARLAALRSR